LLVAAIGLGSAGLDPVGALVAVTSLAAGARDRTVVAFVAVMVVTTRTGVRSCGKWWRSMWGQPVGWRR